jgi:energy-coupling factor transporter ATP-binding protein EcfA2
MTEPLTIRTIAFQAGPTPGSRPLEVPASRVVVLVGPNNAGKSAALREVEGLAVGGDPVRKVVDRIDVNWPESLEVALDLLDVHRAPTPEGHPRHLLHISTPRPGQSSFTAVVDPAGLAQSLANQRDQPLRAILTQPYTVRLDGRGRFALAGAQSAGDLQAPAENHLWKLLQDEQRRLKVRKLIEQAFDLHFCIDITGVQSLRIRMSDHAPDPAVDELSFNTAAREFAGQATPLEELGDGVQAFVGLAAAVVGLPSRILLIDEPEAFLHPTLARRLGAALVELGSDRPATLMVATHSADFLMGCVEAAAETTIVRLTFERRIPTARALAASELRELMYSPLLRSTGSIRGVFQRAVVVTEADNDRAFYTEINRRLERVGRGVRDALFVNAQNWQTTARIIGPLRTLGVPAAALIDLDAVAAGDTWAPFFRAAGLDEATCIVLGRQRAACAAHLRAVGKPAYKAKGIDALTGSEQAEVGAFVDRMAEYGIFLVPVGTLECWLRPLGIAGKGTRWTTRMLERLGAEPAADDWVGPETDDVWAFLDRIAAWVDDPDRRGIPAE